MTPLAPLTSLVHPSDPTQPGDRLLVMLHGWGADAQDLFPLGAALGLGHYRCVFVNAPFPHPQVPQGRAWYNLESPQFEGLGEARQALRNYVVALAQEARIPLSRTVLGGFSQGGAMAVDVGLTLPLAGIFSLSGYLHFQPEAIAGPIPPMLVVHGTLDQVVPIGMARQMRDSLEQIGATVNYQELRMGHEIPAMALASLRQFLQSLPLE